MAQLLQEKEQRLNDPWTRNRLTRWFTERWPHRTHVELSDFAIPKGGASNEMMAFTVAWRAAGQRKTQRCVLRMEVPGEPIAPKLGTWYPTIIEVEHAVQKALAARSACPVPPMIGIETSSRTLGRPFYVMGWVAGRIVPTANPAMDGYLADELGPAQRRRLVESAIEAMAKVHQFDWKDTSLAQLGEVGRSKGGGLLSAHLRAYTSLTMKYLRGADHPLLLAGLDWLSRNEPEPSAPALTWGDARLGNMVFDDDGNVRAALDWELAALLPPAMDVAHFLMTDYMVHEVERAGRLPGYPTRGEQLAHYEQCAGSAARDLGYWEIFCAVKCAYVFLRVVRRMQDQQVLDDRSEALLHDNFAVHYLADRLGKRDSGLV